MFFILLEEFQAIIGIVTGCGYRVTTHLSAPKLKTRGSHSQVAHHGQVELTVGPIRFQDKLLQIKGL